MIVAEFQSQVNAWMQRCFGPIISADRRERNHRFLEEALELVQALDCTREEAHQLVDYVFSRPIGDPHQETGGVMVTLAALCNAATLKMGRAGEDELTRINSPEIIEKIRRKQAAKPQFSPFPALMRGLIRSRPMRKTEERIGSWIPLVSGTAHYPMDPRADDISVEDIAHHLSNLCRYNGGTKWFYSVAQHVVLITRWLRSERYEPIVQLYGLHHDDPEALTGFGDVCGPVKGEAPIVSSLEALLWERVVMPKFGLDQYLPMIVEEADMRIRADEKSIVLNPTSLPWKANDPPLGIEICQWSPEESRAAYLQEHYRLVEEMANG